MSLIELETDSGYRTTCFARSDEHGRVMMVWGDQAVRMQKEEERLRAEGGLTADELETASDLSEVVGTDRIHVVARFATLSQYEAAHNMHFSAA